MLNVHKILRNCNSNCNKSFPEQVYSSDCQIRQSIQMCMTTCYWRKFFTTYGVGLCRFSFNIFPRILKIRIAFTTSDAFARAFDYEGVDPRKCGNNAPQPRTKINEIKQHQITRYTSKTANIDIAIL